MSCALFGMTPTVDNAVSACHVMVAEPKSTLLVAHSCGDDEVEERRLLGPVSIGAHAPTGPDAAFLLDRMP